MKIQSTVIADDRVEILVADAAVPEMANEMIELALHVPYERTRPLVEAQLKALQRARAVIDAEIEAIKSL